MAGDWIPIRLDLHEDPAVFQMAAILGLDRFAVVGRLVRVWGWANANSSDGKICHAASVTKTGHERDKCHAAVTQVSHDCPALVPIDVIAEAPGFGFAMVKVGWLEVAEGGFTFPHFDRWNSQSAKQRVLAAKRKQAERGRDSVTQMSRCERDKNVTREEKRREEIDTERQTPNPPFELVDTPKRTESGSSEKTPVFFASSSPISSDLATVGHSDGLKVKTPQIAIKTKSCDVVFPDALNTQAFVEVWSEWVADRRERRKPITDRAAKTQLAALAKVGEAKAIETIRRSIANGWTGLFPDAIANGAVRGAGRTKAEQLDDYFADQVESVLESQIKEGGRQYE